MLDIINEIKSKNSFALFSHENPDPDTIGSTLALKKILEGMGKTVSTYCESNIPDSYYIFDGAKEYNGELIKADCFIAIDIASETMLGKYLNDFLLAKSSIRIDHHINGNNFAKINFVSGASACAILIFELAQRLEVSITGEISTLLFLGICGDTGLFKNSNTDSVTFEVCAHLLSLGADIKKVYGEFFDKKTVPFVKMSSSILENAVLNDDLKFAILTASKGDYLNYNLDPENDNLSNLPNTYLSCGYNIAVIIKEKDDGIHCSFRSKPEFDVSSIAAVFGGGGHKNASGCKIDDSLDNATKLVIQEIEKYLKTI